VERSLTREESKLVTRRRLLASALRMLEEAGYGKLSASAVARHAGVAQPTFYVHFRDKEELIRTLAEEQIELLRAKLRGLRSAVQHGRDVEAIRETHRVTLRAYAEHRGLFLLYLQERSQPESPFGEQARRLCEEIRRDLMQDLAGSLGLRRGRQSERTRIAMIADGLVAQTEALGRGYVDGRYPDLEAVVDVLVAFTLGVLASHAPG
jgi:TetR/AcrR family transcriptional regulator, fatty acid biosynthesis regulator